MLITALNAAAFSGKKKKPGGPPPDFNNIASQIRRFEAIEGHTGLTIYPGLVSKSDEANAKKWADTQRVFHPRHARVLVASAAEFLDRLKEKGHWVIPRQGDSPLIVHRKVIKQLKKSEKVISKILEKLRAISKSNSNRAIAHAEILHKAKKFALKSNVLKAMPPEANATMKLIQNAFDPSYSEQQVAHGILRAALISSYNQRLAADPTLVPDTLTRVIEETPRHPMHCYERNSGFKPASVSFLAHRDWKPKNTGPDDTGDGSRFSLAG